MKKILRELVRKIESENKNGNMSTIWNKAMGVIETGLKELHKNVPGRSYSPHINWNTEIIETRINNMRKRSVLRIDNIQKILLSEPKEYIINNDDLHNFIVFAIIEINKNIGSNINYLLLLEELIKERIIEGEKES